MEASLECLMESRMRRKTHVRFGERSGRNRRATVRYGAPGPTLRDPTPSAEDLAFTRRMESASRMIGVRLADHLVVGGLGRWVSLAECGQI